MRKLRGALGPRTSRFVVLAGLMLVGCSKAHFSGQAPAKKADAKK